MPGQPLQGLKAMTGQRFGRLVVIKHLGKLTSGGSGLHYWLCKCDCGNETSVYGGHLRLGRIVSCGCYCRERTTTHASCKHQLYRVWRGMIHRCHNEQSPEYANYGGRGVVVCQGWRSSPHSFFAQMGPKPTKDHSIDRINNNGNYSCGLCEECRNNGWPLNCRWATQSEQCRNTRRNVVIRYRGESKTAVELSEITGLSHSAICNRFHAGWTADDIVNTPARSPRLSTKSIYEYHGDYFTLHQLAAIAQISSLTMRFRLRRGWSVERAVEQPLQERASEHRKAEMDSRIQTA